MTLTTLFMISFLSNNILLVNFLGLCPFFGVSNKENKALSMGISIILVMLLANIITYFLDLYILKPFNIEYLKTIMFILIIAALVQLLELVIRRYFIKLQKLLGIYLPLITTNCAVLGVVLICHNNNYSFIETIIFTLGSSLGYAFVIYLFATIREKIANNPIPKALQGIPIALITACIMSLLFMRYIG